MQRIYLDQNKWLDLSRAAWGRKGGERYADALAVARFGVEHSLASFPLSSSHYVETLRRKDAASRRRLAGLMVALSRFHAIAPPSRIIEGELDAALYSRFGKPGDPRPLQPFGMGVWFAMGTEEHRYQVPADADLPPGRRYEFELWANEFLQAAMIMGPNEGQAVPGMVENNFYLDIPRKYAQGETRLSASLRSAATSAQRDDWVTASELVDILDPLNRALERAKIATGESEDLSSKEGLIDLLDDLPSRAVAVELRKQRHANYQTRWDPNDLEDIAALSVAVPYCDVVVTRAAVVSSTSCKRAR